MCKTLLCVPLHGMAQLSKGRGSGWFSENLLWENVMHCPVWKKSIWSFSTAVGATHSQCVSVA